MNKPCHVHEQAGSMLMMVVISLGLAVTWILLIQRQSSLCHDVVRKSEVAARVFHCTEALFNYGVVLCKEAQVSVFHKKFSSRQLYEGPWPCGVDAALMQGMPAHLTGAVVAKKNGPSAVLLTATLSEGKRVRMTISATLKLASGGSIAISSWSCLRS